MAKSQSEEIILSYYDCLLRAKDVALLKGPHWLNDVIIGFYFEYLDETFNKEKKQLYFISPELTQLLKMTEPSQYGIFLDADTIAECKCIFFPLNNCDSRDAAGGTHWSLLVYCKEEKTCYHLDSSKGCNYNIASEFAKNIINYVLNKDECGRKLVEPNCPQQDNGYDCGIYVLCLADVIIEHIMKTGKVKGCNYNQAKDLVPIKRTQLLKLINDLKSKLSTDK
ncbi:sentrin-specific protease 8 [Calliopsis andreniformis]|uniref:sentrin-specific protease 8 n=1 Tax=Calliopsis andreniformis TaxID=337506 RepID=UPI003FCCB487